MRTFIFILSFIFSFSLIKAQNTQFEDYLPIPTFGMTTANEILEAQTASLWRLKTTMVRNYTMGTWVQDDSIHIDYYGEEKWGTYSTFRWNSSMNDWTPYYRVRHTYSQDLPTVILYETWSAGNWQNLSRITYTYDLGGNILSGVVESWSGGVWNYVSKVNMSYTNGLLIEEILQSYTGGVWENNTRKTYTYYLNETLAQKVEQSWNGTTWEFDFKNQYTYDGNGNIIQDLKSTHNGTQFENDRKESMTYDADDNMTYKLTENWSTGAWENYRQESYTFDQGHQTLHQRDNWSITQTTWIPVTREVIIYDANWDKDRLTNYSWNGSNWNTDDRELYTYDGNHNNTYTLYQDYGMGWYDVNDATHTYETYYLATEDLSSEQLEFLLFPNPASDQVSVAIENAVGGDVELAVYNTLGQKIIAKQLYIDFGNATLDLDLSNLAAGNYMVRLQTAEGQYVKQLVVR
jgi:hypothetical protein